LGGYQGVKTENSGKGAGTTPDMPPNNPGKEMDGVSGTPSGFLFRKINDLFSLPYYVGHLVPLQLAFWCSNFNSISNPQLYPPGSPSAVFRELTHQLVMMRGIYFSSNLDYRTSLIVSFVDANGAPHLIKQ
jgi:hypothetical protein